MEIPQQNAGYLSLMDRLPVEIISEVFCHYVALDLPAWRLAFICRRWRVIAMRTPELWTRIIVGASRFFDDAKWSIFGVIKSTRGRAAVCLNVDEFKEAIGMAGSLPLHIKLLFGFAEKPDEWKGYLASLIKEVLCSSITCRIFDLYLDPSGLTPQLTWDESFCNDAQWSPLSNLRALCVSPPYRPGPWMDPLLKSIYCSSKTSLRRFTIHTLVQVQDDTQIDNIVIGFINLEELNCSAHEWPVTGASPITLRHLTSLNVRCSAIHFGRLNLPQLRSLIIVDIPLTQPTDEKFHHFSLPNLDTLTANIRTTEWLEHIVAPKLRVLSVIGVDLTSARTQHLNLLPPNLFPTVEQFNLHLTPKNCAEDPNVQDAVLIWALGAVPEAISLRIHIHSLVDYDRKLRMALLNLLASVNEREVLCPRLRDLDMEYSSPRGGPLRFTMRDDEDRALRRIVEVRRKMGRELNSLVVRSMRGRLKTIHRIV